ncbi:MAG: CBS domain-containing protein [Saprospirales bacterium]|nr:MAG: CBS domain-containing protein [Saprospirales bacterium]
MDLTEKISNIMTANVHYVSKDDELFKALRLIRNHKIRHLPVVDGSQIVGIISSSDLNRLTFGGLFSGTDPDEEGILQMLSISQVMTSKVRTVSSDSTIKEVAEIFAREEFHALPVADRDGKLAGIVTTTDVIKYILEKHTTWVF